MQAWASTSKNPTHLAGRIALLQWEATLLLSVLLEGGHWEVALLRIVVDIVNFRV
jgi:hypothetical protein